MSQNLGHEAEDISFHAYSCRMCSLMFNLHGRMLAFIAVYFPTTRESEEAVDELYDLLTLVVDSFPRNAVVIIGGDFNATVGGPQAGDDANILGCWGQGPRNERGSKLIAWATGHGLQFSSRMANQARVADSWTCCRSMDGSKGGWGRNLCGRTVSLSDPRLRDAEAMQLHCLADGPHTLMSDFSHDIRSWVCLPACTHTTTCVPATHAALTMAPAIPLFTAPVCCTQPGCCTRIVQWVGAAPFLRGLSDYIMSVTLLKHLRSCWTSWAPCQTQKRSQDFCCKFLPGCNLHLGRTRPCTHVGGVVAPNAAHIAAAASRRLFPRLPRL